MAYYTTADAGVELRADSLRAGLAQTLPDYMVPTRYVRLTALPLTANGKVDRRALLSLEVEAGTDSGYQPPVGEVETLLAQIWAEVLKVDRIGRRDDFFLLGGNSLSAVRMVDRLEKAGIHTEVDDLFACSTLETFAASAKAAGGLVRGDEPILVRAAGSQPPLFLVHDGLGAVDYAQLLTRHLAEDIPVYALPPSSVGAPSLRTIEAMSERLVRLVRTSRPSGPYRIAGWSFGGLLAYEMAAQLIGHDEIVEFVSLIDHTTVTRSRSSQEAANDAMLLLGMLRRRTRRLGPAVSPRFAGARCQGDGRRIVDGSVLRVGAAARPHGEPA